MKKKLILIIFFLVGFLFVKSSEGALMLLKNGRFLQGSIKKQDNGNIEIEISGKILSFAQEEVAKILEDDLVPGSIIDSYLVQVKALSPDDASGFFSLGLFCLEKQMFDYAEQAFQKAGEIEPKYEKIVKAKIRTILNQKVEIVYKISEKYYGLKEYSRSYEFLLELLTEASAAEDLRNRIKDLEEKLKNSVPQNDIVLTASDIKDKLGSDTVYIPATIGENFILKRVILEQPAELKISIGQKYLKDAEYYLDLANSGKVKGATLIALKAASLVYDCAPRDSEAFFKARKMVKTALEKRKNIVPVTLVEPRDEDSKKEIISFLFALSSPAEKFREIWYYYQQAIQLKKEADRNQVEGREDKTNLQMIINICDIIISCSEELKQRQKAFILRQVCLDEI